MPRRAAFAALGTALLACGQPRPSPPDPAVAPSASSTSAVASAPVVDASADGADVVPAADASRPRLYVRARVVPVHADPSARSRPLGALAAGDSVELRDDPPRAGPGCSAFRAVAPRGWVCADGDLVTLDATDPVWLGLSAHAPDFNSPWPYAYGESKGARRHRALPGVDAPAWPSTLFDPHLEIARRSTVAWLDDLEVGGVRWLRDSDMSFVRADRVVPYERSDFHGVAIEAGVSLPLAFFRRSAHARLTHDPEGRLVPTGDPWPRLGWTALTGKSEKHGPHTFWETREDGVWIDARDAAIIAPEPAPGPAPRGTWIEVAALGGWLVAYEDDRPVYATMISAGKLGAAKPDPDHEPHQPAATTPIGTFRVREKLLTATLQSDLDDGSEYVHAEVPWSQRFYDKYLLHTAYWHDAWGEGHSGGCVNLSPVDARWLFSWTEPRLPPGWHSVRSGDGDDAASTTVVVHP